jgi:hypothetical protein
MLIAHPCCGKTGQTGELNHTRISQVYFDAGAHPNLRAIFEYSAASHGLLSGY